MKKIKNQKGFSVVEILIVLVVAALIAGGLFFVLKKSKDDGGTTGSVSQQDGETPIKHLGINLDYYDKNTNRAGDIEFTKFKFSEGTFGKIFVEYGEREPNNDVEGNSVRYNPQPTFLAPLGTKVHSLVDGTVVNVPKLYSNDYSVMVQPDGSDKIYETEHVINVTVKQGDKVKAGDVIAEVSDYGGNKLGGLGLVEIGVLLPGNPPKHACLFDYLDPSIKDETLKKITDLKKSWEEYRGEPDAYDESAALIPGCVSRDLIEG